MSVPLSTMSWNMRSMTPWLTRMPAANVGPSSMPIAVASGIASLMTSRLVMCCWIASSSRNEVTASAAARRCSHVSGTSRPASASTSLRYHIAWAWEYSGME